MKKPKYFLIKLFLIVIFIFQYMTHYYPLDIKPVYLTSRFFAHTLINDADCHFPEKDDFYYDIDHYNFTCGGSIWTGTPTEGSYTLYIVPNNLLKNKYKEIILNKKYGKGLIEGKYYLIKGYLSDFDYFSSKETPPDPIEVYKRFKGKVIIKSMGSPLTR